VHLPNLKEKMLKQRKIAFTEADGAVKQKSKQ
jgi:hypothetical protein